MTEIVDLTPEMAQIASDTFNEAYARASDPNEGLNPEGIGLAGWEAWAISYALGAALVAVLPLIAKAAVQVELRSAADELDFQAAEHGETVHDYSDLLRKRADEIGGTS